MKLIIEILSLTGDERTTHHTFKKTPISIGRGLQNDIIIPDPYIDSEHVKIEYKADTQKWIIRDNKSTNGLRINNIKRLSSDIKSGDTVKIGQTELHIFSPNHKIAKTLKIKENHPLLSFIEKPSSAWLFLIVAILVLQLWSYLEIWTNERGVIIATTAAATFGIITIWSLLWSVASRLIIHKSNFKQHASIISLYLITSVFMWYIKAYTDFLTSENWLSDIVNYSTNFILLSLLVYASLTFTSKMHQRKILISSTLFALGVVCGIFILTLISKKDFNQRPVYSSAMEPYLSQIAPTDTVNEFMIKNKKLFTLKKFRN